MKYDIKQENVSLKRNLKEQIENDKIKLVQERKNNEKVIREDINLDDSN